MLEATIEIEDKLAAKGYKRALQGKALRDIAHYYATKLIIVWVVIAVADGLYGAGNLIFTHLIFIFGLWIVATVYGYADWSRRIAQTKGWAFRARLDEQGVVTSAFSNEERKNWNYYKSYKEYEDYLQIESTQGEITFLPKTPELFEVVEFTKQKIPQKRL
ncbi:MAG TPA: hypothetical protein VF556_00860 [Pyrinomonadaceae bacterium]|jgi:hypothetical protein